MIVSNRDTNVTDRKGLSTELAMGGQALIEGVMMRSPTHVAMAVRRPNQEITLRRYPYIPIGRRIKWLGIPVIRGAVGLIEALKIGTDALQWSAGQAMAEEEAKVNKKSGTRAGLALTLLLAFVFGLGLFMYLPYWVAKYILGSYQGQFAFHLIAGGIRIGILLAYMASISLMKDIRRVFQYHGAEHKTIMAFEDSTDLKAELIIKYSRFHPRCGTSFLLIVAIVSVLFFAAMDTLVVAWAGSYPNVLTRFLAHLPLIPIVAGLSYEFLRYSSKHTSSPIIKFLIMPGLWLQRITTKDPDVGMCEVAATALLAALEMPNAGAMGETDSSSNALPSAA